MQTTGTVDQAAVTAVPLATMKGEEVEKIRSENSMTTFNRYPGQIDL